MQQLPAFVWVFATALLLVLLVMLAVPLWLITRRPRIGVLRAVPGHRVRTWWVAATVPWVVSIAVFQSRKSVSVSASSPFTLIVVILAVVGLYLVLVVLPLMVIVGTAIWASGSRPDVANGSSRNHKV